jgi:hypothetical protein
MRESSAVMWARIRGTSSRLDYRCISTELRIRNREKRANSGSVGVAWGIRPDSLLLVHAAAMLLATGATKRMWC